MFPDKPVLLVMRLTLAVRNPVACDGLPAPETVPPTPAPPATTDACACITVRARHYLHQPQPRPPPRHSYKPPSITQETAPIASTWTC